MTNKTLAKVAGILTLAAASLLYSANKADARASAPSGLEQKIERVEQENVYTVQPGDNLWNIAKKYGVPFSELKQANLGINYDSLRIGQKIKLPEIKKTAEVEAKKQVTRANENNGPNVYAVLNGDTLTNIAENIGVPYTRLVLGNYNIDRDNLKIGQKIKIPGKDEKIIENDPSIHYRKLHEEIFGHESLETKMYLDSKKIPTIGIGFNLTKHGAKERIEYLGYDYGKVLKGKQEISEEDTRQLMKEDLDIAVITAKNYMGNGWNGLHYLAKEILINMVYNMGEESLAEFKDLRKELMSLGYADASKEMKDSEWHGDTGARARELTDRMENVKISKGNTSLILQRNEFTPESTIGALYEDLNQNGIIDGNDEHLCYTLELPWRDNKNNVSCILEGVYSVKERRSEKYGEHFAVDNVVGRSDILIHAGNYPKDTSGCVLVGNTKAKDYVGNSRTTMNGLRNRFQGRGNMRFNVRRK